MPAWGVISVLVGTVLLVVYYVYLVRAFLEMLGRKRSTPGTFRARLLPGDGSTAAGASL